MSRLPTRVIIELRPSLIDILGVGVFAAVAISSGERVAGGISEDDYKSLVSWEEFKHYNEALKRKIMRFCIGTPEGFIPPDDFDFNKLSIEWYFNHSCNGSLGFDDNGDFVAIRDIAAGNELSYDYGLAESNPSFRLHCNCNESNCRKIITGNDWRDEEFRTRHHAYMLPRLRVLPTIISTHTEAQFIQDASRFGTTGSH